MSNAAAGSVKIKTGNSLLDLVTWRSLTSTRAFSGMAKQRLDFSGSRSNWENWEKQV